MSSDDDDESSFHLQKLLPERCSPPSTDTALTASLDRLDNSQNEISSPARKQDDHASPGGRTPKNQANNTDECYRWLLHERQRKLTGETSSTDTSISSTSSSTSSDSSFISLPLPTPPDGGWGWMIVLGSFIVLVICDGLSYSFAVLYSELLVQFGESHSKTSLVGSIFFGVSMILGPLASTMTTRYGCRKMTIVGGVLSSVGFLLSYFATSIEMMCLTFSVVVGTGFSFCYVTSVVIVHFYFDKRRSFATGLGACGTGVGTFTLAPLMEYLISEYSLRGLFLILAGISLNLVVCGMLFRPLKFTEEERWKYFFAEFDKLPHVRQNLELGRIRNFSECTEFSTEMEALDEENRTMSMLSLPTFVCGKTTNDSPGILMEALKNSRNPHLTYQRYAKNAFFRSNSDDAEDKAIETNELVDDKTFTISIHSDPSKTQSNTLPEDTICQENIGPTTDVPSDASYPVMRSSSNSKTSKLSVHLQLPRKDDSRKSTSFIDLNNVMKAKSVNRVVSGMNMGKHNAMGIQLLLYRTDIFFRRQLGQITDNKPCLLATSCPEFLESNTQPEVKWKGFSHSMKRFLIGTYNAVLGMTDLSLFRNVFFTLFTVSNFVFFFWSDIPYMFSTDYAVERGVDAEKASFIISIIGILSTIGQLVFGIVGDMKINLINVYAVILAISGVFTALVPFMTSYWSMVVVYGLFGFFVSVTFPFVSVLLVNYLGVGQLTDAYGLLMLMQGVANILGPPFAGWISDVTHSYDEAYYLSGIFYAVSGLIMFVVYIPGCHVKQMENTDHDNDGE